MKKLLLILFALMFAVCVYADPPAPFPIEINSQSRVAPEVWTFRNNVRTFRATFKDGTNPVSLVGATPFMSWSTNELSSGVVTSSWALVNTGTGGVVDFTFAAAALNYATMTNVYEIGVAGSVAVYNRGVFLIKPSPFSTGTNVQPFVTNQNLSGMSFVNAPWFENLTLTTGGSAYVWSGTGTTRNLNVPTASAGSTGTVNEIVSGSSTRLFVTNATGPQVSIYFDGTGLATGAPLYVESFTGSVGSIAGLATGTPIYLEADTNALAQLAATSTVFESRIDGVEAYTSRVVTLEGYTSRVVATEGYTNRAASALSSSVWNVAESTTNAAPRNSWITTNAAFEARLDILEPYTDRVVAVEGYSNRAASALSSSVWALADSTSNATPRNSWIVTNAAFEARIDTLETGSYTKVEGYASNAQFTVTHTNHAGRIAIMETGKAAQVDFVASNAVWETRVDALETGRAYQADYVATSNIVAILNTNVVVRDTTGGQETMGAVHSRDRLSALTNLTVAATNAAGSEVLNNGTFTGSEAGWSLTNASYNANNVLVLPSATASITYTQAVITAGKVYQLSFANTLAYGSNFTLFAISIGGYTNVFASAPTGTHTMTVATWTEQPLVFRATPGTNQLVIDTVSLKEDVVGDLWVARRGVFGRDVNAGGNLTVESNITAGTISGMLSETQGLPGVLGRTNTANRDIVFLTTNGVSMNDFRFYESPDYAATVVASTSILVEGWGVFGGNGSGRILLDGGYYFGNTDGGLYFFSDESPIAVRKSDGGYNFANGGMIYSNARLYVNGPSITNLTAANIAAGGTFPALNAINLTNLPSAATTAGVNSISHTGAVSSDLTFADGTGIDVSQTNATFYWSVIPGAVSGIDGRTVTNAVPLNLGTGAVALASLGNVAQTGQVNLININGTNYAGNLGFSGAGLSVSGAQLVFSGGSGGTGTLYAINGYFGPELSVTGGTGVTVQRTNSTLYLNAPGSSTGALFAINGIYGPEATIAAGANVAITTTGAIINVASTASGSGGSPYTESATAIISPTSGTHTIAGDGSHIGGGGLNTSTGTYSTVAGGYGNAARGAYASVGSGRTNIAHGTGSRVSGGANNRANGTLYDTIGGGLDNLIPNTGGGYSTIAGGWDNDAANGSYVTVGGGYQNYAEEDGATVAGGSVNSARGNHAFIGGGSGNQIENGGAANADAVIAGGYFNFIAAAAEQRCTIGGGGFNYIDGATYAATIAGGHGNTNTAYEGIIPGGRINAVAGRAAFAAGTGARALHEGSFVWADRFQGITGTVFSTTSSNQVMFRAHGGFFFAYVGTPIRQPMCLGVYTNQNATLIVPYIQGDYYIDAGSNTVVRTFDGTTNGWRATSAGGALVP